jgi:RNA polymerase sigma-70 factor (ECF subfamily)
MQVDTRNILHEIASGDNEAFKTLFEIFFPKVKVFLVKFLKDDKAAEDIAQDIFVKIWSMRQALPEIKSFNTYLYRMTRNAALNYLRDKKVTLEISEIPIRDDKDIEQEYYRKEKELLIQLVVDQMPAQRRKVFTMSRYMGMTNDQIAKSLGISKHTVENHLSLSLKELRDLVVAFALFFLI